MRHAHYATCGVAGCEYLSRPGSPFCLEHTVNPPHALRPFPNPILMPTAARAIAAMNAYHWPGQCDNPLPHDPHQRSTEEACPGL
jgi:hypothetical protein